MLYYCKSTFCIIGHALMVQCLHNPSSLSSNQQRDFLLLFQTTRPHAISLAPRLHPVFVIRFMSLYVCTCISKRCYAQVSKVLYKNRNKLMYELTVSLKYKKKQQKDHAGFMQSCWVHACTLHGTLTAGRSMSLHCFQSTSNEVVWVRNALEVALAATADTSEHHQTHEAQSGWQLLTHSVGT